MEVSDFVEKPLLEKIQDLLERKPGNCDVAFCVGKEKKIVGALKVILKASSPVLEKEFEEKWEVAVVKEGDGILLPDFDPIAFELFVKLTSLDTWSLEVLKGLHLPPNQILNLLSICRRFEIRNAVKNLEILATTFLQSFREYKDTNDFLQLSLTNFKSVIGSDEIGIEELDVFHAAIRWADFQCRQMEVLPTEEQLRKVLGDCLFEIRFPLMTWTEFTEVRESKDILTAEEIFGIYGFIGLTGNKNRKRLEFDSKKLPFKSTPRNKVQALKSNPNRETYNIESLIPPGISRICSIPGSENAGKSLIVGDSSRKSNLKMASTSSTSTTPAFALGIDFGTTSCCVAVLRHPTKKPEVLLNSYDTSITPSYVAYNADSDSNQNSEDGSGNDNSSVHMGETVNQNFHENPAKRAFIMRLISQSFYDPKIQKYQQLWPFHLVNMMGNVGVQIGDEEKLPQEIAAELLRHLRKTSEEFLRSPIDCAVVTIPVYYSEIQKGLTEWACLAAGFKSIHFIAKPVAAAIAYGIRSSLQSHEAKTCLIYDLGGGTFSVTVFRLGAKNRVEVKATGGDDRLGGEDFNDLITELCIDEFQRIHGINLAEGKTSDDAEVRMKTVKKLRRIRNECEVQKCNLSSAKLTSVVVSLDNIHENFNLHVTVTRSKFEELIQSLLNRSMKILDETVKKSGCKKEEIDDVILIGGSSRIPKVRRMVQGYFVGKQIRITINADEAVACGAAVHAYNVFKENGALFSVVTLLEETQSGSHVLESASSLQLQLPGAALPSKTTIRWGKKINGFPTRSVFAAVAVGNTIYCFGGRGDFDDFDDFSDSKDDPMDMFVLNVDERKKKWKKLLVENSDVNPTQRHGHSAVTYKQFVIIFGGLDEKKYEFSNSTYLFNTRTLKWDKPKVTGNVPHARLFPSAVVFRNELLIYGGEGEGVTSDVHSLDLESFCWSTIETKGIPPSVRRGNSTTIYDDRFILFFGGEVSKVYNTVNTIWSFNLNNNTWTSVKSRGTPPSCRKDHCAFMHNERMYIIGGTNCDKKFDYFNDVFCYDPEKFEWKEVTPNGDAPSPRFAAGCVAVNDQVFIFGGWNRKQLKDFYVLQL